MSRSTRQTEKSKTTSGAAALPRLELCETRRLVFDGGRCVDLELKDALLLAYLALEGPAPRGRLAALLWPNVDDERARGNLRQRLLRLRRLTGVELITGHAQASLSPGIAHDLADADALMAGVDASQAGGLAQWLEAQRERRHRARIDWLDAACTQAEAEGDLAAALEHAGALVALDPLSEHAHRRVMKLHYLRGDVAAAQVAYERCAQVLERELNAAPSKDTEALRASIGRAVVPAGPLAAARAVPLSVLRPPRLIGRDAEWAALRAAWAESAPAVVLGEAGLGKSRLIGDLARSQRHAVVVSARPGDERVVYAVTTRLLRQLPREIVQALDASVRAELARLLPEHGAAAPIRSDSERSRFFNAVAATLDASRGQVHGIVVDDLHFADDASIELLHHLAGSGERPWVFAMRPAEIGAAARGLIDTLRAAAGHAWIELAPLTLTQMAELVDSLGIDGLNASELAPALMRHTGGNPLFALESIKASLAQAARVVPAQLPVAASMGALVERRIGRLSPQAVRLARCAAVAGQDFSAELAAHVLGVRALDLADAWAELEAAQVFRDGAFAHDLIHDAALASVPAPIARTLHRELADWLGTRGGEPARIAAHRLAAGEDELATRSLEAAAQRCIDAGRVIEGGRHLRRAAEIAAAAGAAAARVFELYYAAANALWLSASTTEFNELIEPMRRWARTDSELARYWMAEGHRAEREGATDAYAAANERALALHLQVGDAPLAAACRIALGHLCAHRGQYEKALHHLSAAADAFRELGDPGDEAAVRSSLGTVLSTLCRFDEANRQLDLAVPGLVQAKYYAYLIANYNTRAGNALAQGDARRAVELARQALGFAVAGEAEAGPRAVTRQRLIESLRRLGRFREALDVLAGARADFGDETHPDCRSIGLEAVPMLLDLGRGDQAASTLSEFEGQSNVNLTDAELARLLRLRTSGNGSQALALARSADLAQIGSPARRCAFAIELAARLDASPALALLDETIGRAEDLGLGAYLAGLHLARAEQLHRQGDAPAATAACDRAAEALVDFDADAYRPALLLRLQRLEQALGRAERAAAHLREAVTWVRHAEDAYVPAEHRHAFMNRNAINGELMALVARQS